MRGKRKKKEQWREQSEEGEKAGRGRAEQGQLEAVSLLAHLSFRQQVQAVAGVKRTKGLRDTHTDTYTT